MDTSQLPESMYRKGFLSGLTPNVIRMGFVSFFADVSSEMLYPLIPIFLRSVLGAPMEAVGLIEGVAEATASLLKTVSGRLSDLSNRRIPFVFGGYSISALAKPLIALAHIWPVVLLARILDRIGKGLRSSPRDALLAESVPPERRGKAFGLHRGMDTLGAVIGPLLALLLVHFTSNNLRLIFLLSVIPGLLGALLVLTIRERPHATRSERATPAGSIRFHQLPAGFRGYLIAWGAFALANSSDVFIILRASSLVQSAGRTLQYATTYTVILYTFYNLVYAFASPYLGHLSDRIDRKRVLIGGLLVFAAVYIGFAITQNPWHLWPLFAIYGLYIAATDGVGKALAVDLVPSSIRASALGILGTVSGIAALAASGIAGILWDTLGPWATFGYGALGALLGAMLLARLKAPKLNE